VGFSVCVSQFGTVLNDKELIMKGIKLEIIGLVRMYVRMCFASLAV
jgi:hypothetical protein